MKARIFTATLATLSGAAIVLLSSTFVVEEGTQVIVTEFGKPVDDVQTSGLHFKTPFIQEAYYLEKRLLPWDGSPESMQTKDKKRIDIAVWARWRISDP
ncbi:MAG: SPFH domain-containing protein, partial [Planctomycetota bacterium]|nr:SPFH domain-containing protein [Planctomycetota bacterium]